MDRTKSTPHNAPPREPGDGADRRPRYEPPRVVKRRSLVLGTGQSYVSSVGYPDGTQAGGLPANG